MGSLEISHYLSQGFARPFLVEHKLVHDNSCPHSTRLALSQNRQHSSLEWLHFTSCPWSPKRAWSFRQLAYTEGSHIREVNLVLQAPHCALEGHDLAHSMGRGGTEEESPNHSNVSCAAPINFCGVIGEFGDQQWLEQPSTSEQQGISSRRKDGSSAIMSKMVWSQRKSVASTAQAPHNDQQYFASRRPVKRLCDKEGQLEEATSSDSFSSVTSGRPPLTAADEAQCASHVQDLLTLEAKKVELEKQLGRKPTEQEWAEHMGMSVFRLYARMGRGRAAKRKMVEANLQLVHSVAHQFHGQGLSHTELCQEGVLGLLKSTEKFDSTRETKFSSYGFFWVKEQMGAAVKKFGRALRIGRSVYKNASSLLRQKSDFESEHGRLPTCEELVDVSKLDEKKIRQVFQIMSPVKSLDSSANSKERTDGHNPSFRQLGDTSKASQPWLCARDMEQRTEVIRVLASLSPREQQIMHLRYGLGGQPPLSRSEVAMVLGVSYPTVRTTEKGALQILKELALEDGFMDYLNDSLWVD